MKLPRVRGRLVSLALRTDVKSSYAKGLFSELEESGIEYD